MVSAGGSPARLTLSLPAELGPPWERGTEETTPDAETPDGVPAEADPRLLRWLACWAGARR
jgi:hypothetical protein